MGISISRRGLLLAGVAVLTLWAARVNARGSEEAERKEIEAFHKRFVELHRKMDTAGVLALCAEDGVSLMPGDAPMVGKKKIVAWIEDIVAEMPGNKVTKRDMEFHDILV